MLPVERCESADSPVGVASHGYISELIVGDATTQLGRLV